MSNPFAILDPKPATSDSEKPKYEPKTTSLRTREGGRKIVFPEDWQRLNRENEALKKSRFDTGRYNFPTIEIHGSQQGIQQEDFCGPLPQGVFIRRSK